MKYCVIKNTTTIIDGTDNPLEIMIKNALNAGFVETDIEVLTEEEYMVREDLEPAQEKHKTEVELLKEQMAIMQGALDFIILNY
ncbi:hypothetical protein ACP8HI_25650 [Paenibacillus sp. FA6]|uniref:hypothetical protein n=1 Tax=Paenibacillus sp. FA6 TaxID=3413029 RepID=UPI003F6589CC